MGDVTPRVFGASEIAEKKKKERKEKRRTTKASPQ
jgi:hypothetical protein